MTEPYSRWAQRATEVAVLTALVLIGLKSWAYLATGAVTMLSSLIDSALDAVASLVTLMAVRGAQRPADDEHRFGHGKLEPLAGLAQAAFILGSASLLLIEAVQRFITPQPVMLPSIGIGVSIAAIVLTLALVLFQRWVLRRTASLAVEGDSLHYVSDLITNVIVLVGLWATDRFGVPWLDPLLGLVIGAIVVRSAWGIGVRAYQVLMDREVPDAVRQQIIAIIRSVPGVAGAHDLRTREAGPDLFIQLHLELPDALPLIDAHHISHNVETALLEAFPRAQIIIHQDPIGAVRPDLRGTAA
ncbi:MAG: cation diffusion facilitator family transporter [Elstera sp.]